MYGCARIITNAHTHTHTHTASQYLFIIIQIKLSQNLLSQIKSYNCTVQHLYTKLPHHTTKVWMSFNSYLSTIRVTATIPFSFQGRENTCLSHLNIFSITLSSYLEMRAAITDLKKGSVGICWMLYVPATCLCISGTDLLRQAYALPHWDRSCRPNFPSHPVTIYWHRTDQSQHWPFNARRLAG